MNTVTGSADAHFYFVSSQVVEVTCCRCVRNGEKSGPGLNVFNQLSEILALDIVKGYLRKRICCSGDINGLRC